MKLRPSIADIAVLVVVLVALFLPPRALTAGTVGTFDADGRRAVAFAEARVALNPADGRAAYALAQQWSDAKERDWAVQAASVAVANTKTSPTHWRALYALSMAHIDRYEAKEALAYANEALAACEAAAATTCPNHEQAHVELQQRYLDAGVRSGINPRRDPKAFIEAANAGLRQVRTMGTGVAPQPTPPPAAGSGAGTGTGAPPAAP